VQWLTFVFSRFDVSCGFGSVIVLAIKVLFCIDSLTDEHINEELYSVRSDYKMFISILVVAL
jgi:hypothetical protein